MDIHKLLDKLETKFGNWALDGLMKYVAMLMLTVFILNKAGLLSYETLTLYGPLVKSGQLWRVITFLLIPVSTSPIFLIFELMILIMCADGIEAVLGSFKFTLYYLFGALMMVIAALIDHNIQFTSYHMYLSLFFGYASLHPNQELLFMFIIPIKIKYLAFLSGIVVLVNIIFADWYSRIASILAFANYLIFFAIPALNGFKHQQKQNARRQAFEKAATPERAYRHKCAVCGKTDVSNPELSFRYCTCSACGENGVAFCTEHLAEHKAKQVK